MIFVTSPPAYRKWSRISVCFRQCRWARASSLEVISQVQRSPVPVADRRCAASEQRDDATGFAGAAETRGMVIFMISSVLDDPVSSAASRSGIEGGAGAVVSIVTAKLPEGFEKFAGGTVEFSATRIEKLCVVLLRTDVVMANIMAPHASYCVPSATPSLYNCTKEFAGTVPVIVGVLSLVILSLVEPLFDDVESNGAAGVKTE